MEETYIIIEEDNERKILPEGPEIKEAHREAEERYRRLVEPPVKETGLEAIRQAFLRRNQPEPGGAESPSPEISAEETKPEIQEPIPEDSKPEVTEPPPEETAPEAQEPSPKEPETEPETEPEMAEADGGPRDVPYTVLEESEVEVLNSAGDEKNTPAGGPRLSPAVLAAAGVFLLCILWIYVIWK